MIIDGRDSEVNTLGLIIDCVTEKERSAREKFCGHITS